MPQNTSSNETAASLRERYRWLIQGLILAAAYFLSAKLGLSFSTVATNVTLLWPPTGLALFALLCLVCACGQRCFWLRSRRI